MCAKPVLKECAKTVEF